MYLEKTKPRFLWYLITARILGIMRPSDVFFYEMPDDNLTIKELWHWCKEDNK